MGQYLKGYGPRYTDKPLEECSLIGHMGYNLEGQLLILIEQEQRADGRHSLVIDFKPSLSFTGAVPEVDAELSVHLGARMETRYFSGLWLLQECGMFVLH